ncbi:MULTISPECIES: carbohydrate ABC transporter permease [Streptomyces]|uniref:Carbohydrate ABC transporter permease n=2 Tax=Streptomyces TaxID=1883 RepID=A0ABV9IJ34_9ACTN
MSAADTLQSVTKGAPPDRTGASARPPRRRKGALLPYLLIAPAIIVLAGVLGWPLIDTVLLSFQDERRNNLWAGTSPPWVGLDQYTAILGDSEFWQVTLRTVVFVVVCVVLTMLLGLLMAMLLQRVSTWVRLLMTAALVAVWSMPLLVATSIFRWLFDSDYGLANSLLSKLPGVGLRGHNWFLDPVQGLAIIVGVVVWGAIPFIAISLHSALTQVPQELEEAARIDGARGFGIFRYVIFPVIKPVFVMTTTLNVIWDFGVFGQVFLMRNAHPEPEYQLLGIYSYSKAFESNSFSQGAAISVITVLMLAGVSVYYLRQLMKIGEVE